MGGFLTNEDNFQPGQMGGQGSPAGMDFAVRFAGFAAARDGFTRGGGGGGFFGVGAGGFLFDFRQLHAGFQIQQLDLRGVELFALRAVFANESQPKLFLPQPDFQFQFPDSGLTAFQGALTEFQLAAQSIEKPPDGGAGLDGKPLKKGFQNLRTGDGSGFFQGRRECCPSNTYM